MKKLLFFILIFLSCTTITGYKDFRIKSLSTYDFSIGITANPDAIFLRGASYIIFVDTPDGLCYIHIPFEKAILHKIEDYMNVSPFIRVVCNCGSEERNFQICNRDKDSSCYLYHLYLPEDAAIRRLDHRYN